MKRVSKGYYLLTVIVSAVATVVTAVVSMITTVRTVHTLITAGGQVNPAAAQAMVSRSFLTTGIMAPFALWAIISIMILYYKMWDAIQDGNARTTPGKAVGFLFIPFFNFYWIFVAIYGFAKDYNAYLVRHSLNSPKLAEGLFLTMCIVPFGMIIPVVGWFAFVAAVVILLIVVAKICDAVNALPPATAAATPIATPV
jgi:uncharacterized membrane protein